MLGYKLAQAEALKREIDEYKRLAEERTELVAELEASLSPELAMQVVGMRVRMPVVECGCVSCVCAYVCVRA